MAYGHDMRQLLGLGWPDADVTQATILALLGSAYVAMRWGSVGKGTLRESQCYLHIRGVDTNILLLESRFVPLREEGANVICIPRAFDLYVSLNERWCTAEKRKP